MIKVIIPAFNEEDAIGNVLNQIPKNLVNEIIVIDNNSSDKTGIVAKEHGATVLLEKARGYGYACLKGIDYLKDNPPEIVVFIDGDNSDFPEQMSELIYPIENENFDMVIGSRALGKRQRGSMTPQQIFGNKLATFLIKKIYGYTYTDLGPFRAIRYSSLIKLNMEDKTYGWTVEMQLKAIKKGLKIKEVPVDYRKRIGFSKVSGTLKGTLMAGYKILLWVFKYA